MDVTKDLRLDSFETFGVKDDPTVCHFSQRDEVNQLGQFLAIWI